MLRSVLLVGYVCFGELGNCFGESVFIYTDVNAFGGGWEHPALISRPLGMDTTVVPNWSTIFVRQEFLRSSTCDQFTC